MLLPGPSLCQHSFGSQFSGQLQEALETIYSLLSHCKLPEKNM
jgi:hypothetical protein